MIREELKELSTTPRDLRKFGLVVGGVFLALGGWFLYRHKGLWPYFLGLIVTTVLLSVFYFVVITPLGLIARAFGKDFLSQRFNPQAASYWIARQRPATRNSSDYERQF